MILFISGQSYQVKAQEQLLWHGYEILDTSLHGRNYKIVFPEKANENRDWIWRACIL